MDKVDIYIVNSVAHVRRIVGEKPEQIQRNFTMCLFLCDEFLVKEELDKAGYKSEYFGQHLSPEETLACDKEIFRLIKSWYLDANDDFTIYRNASLGQASRSAIYYQVFPPHVFQLISTLSWYVREIRVEKVFFELSTRERSNPRYRQKAGAVKTVCDHFGISLEIVDTYDLSVEDEKILRRDWDERIIDIDSSLFVKRASHREYVKRLCWHMIYAAKQILSAVRRSTVARYNVLCTNYPPMQKFLEHLSGRAERKWRVHLIESYLKRYFFSEIHGNVLYLTDFRKCKLTLEQAQAMQSIRERFEEQRRSISYRCKFSLYGIDFSDFFGELLSDVIDRLFPHYMGHIDRFNSFLERNKIDLFFTTFDMPWYVSIIVDLCRVRKIPSIDLMDGCRSYIDFKDDLCDYVLCWSEQLKQDYFIDRSGRKDSEVIVTGNPLFEHVHRKFGQRTCNFSRGALLKVLIAGSVFVGRDCTTLPAHVDKATLDMVGALLSRQPARVTIRYRTSKKCLDYYEFLLWKYFKNLGNNCEISDSEESSFENVIDSYNIFITNHSTAIFEAALAGKFCIRYRPNEQEMLAPYDGNGELVVVGSASELGKKIDEYLSGEKYLTGFSEAGVLEKYIGSPEGVSDRILSFVESVLEKSRENSTASPLSNQRTCGTPVYYSKELISKCN